MIRMLCIVILLAVLPACQQQAVPPPNVLIIIADDLSAEALGCYGNELVQTPNIDRLAARGFVMDRAYCQFPICGPARAALLTGLYPQQNGVKSNHYQDLLAKTLKGRPTLPQHFMDHGYTVARAGKIYHMGVPGDMTAGTTGGDHEASWHAAYNFKAPEQHTPGPFQILSNEKLNKDPNQHKRQGFGTAFYAVEASTDGAEQYDVQVTYKSIELLGQYKQAGEPFLLAVGYVRPHVPFVAPRSYYKPYPVEAMALPEQVENDLADIPRLAQTRIGSRTGTDTDEKRRAVLRAYYASVSFMDAQVGRLLDELDKQGLTDNTLIVFMSDHGYHLGEHDLWQKISLHEASARIPLIAVGPGIEPGKRWAGLMEAVDLFPSMCVFAGLPIPEHCVGLDLVTAIGNPRKQAYTLSRNGHLIRTERWAYMRYKDGAEELYDMTNDPKQFTNLTKDATASQTLEHMRERLDTQLEQINR